MDRVLNWLFELRGIADYGSTAHVSRDEAQRAIEAAVAFVKAMKHMLG